MTSSTTYSSQEFSWGEVYAEKYIRIDGVPRLIDSETGDLLGPIVPTPSMEDIGAPYLYEFNSSGEGSRTDLVAPDYSEIADAGGFTIREEDWDPEVAIRVLEQPARRLERIQWAQQRQRILAWKLDEAQDDDSEKAKAGLSKRARKNARKRAARKSALSLTAALSTASSAGATPSASAAPTTSAAPTDSKNPTKANPTGTDPTPDSRPNSVGRLNEFANKHNFDYPIYTLLHRHGTVAEMHCYFLKLSSLGTGKNRKLAKQDAARLMLIQLKNCDFLEKRMTAAL